MTMRMQESWDSLVAELRHIRERGSVDAAYFLTIRGLFDRFSKLVLDGDLPEKGVSLVHYTAWKNALGMFNMNQEKPVLRMYNYEHSNDPNEGGIQPPEWKNIEKKESWVDEFLENDGRWAEDMRFGGSTYGSSFFSGSSDADDDLTCWRLYGNDGRGCSLKISNPSNVNVYKVRYRDRDFNTRTQCEKKEDEQVAERLRRLFTAGKEVVDGAPDEYRHIVGPTVAQGLRQVIYGYYHLVKHRAYLGEKEWRMVTVMPRRDTIQYDTTSEDMVKRYINGPALKDLLISASAITIGPTVPNRGAARAYLEHLVRDKHKIEHVVVKNSDKIYRPTDPSTGPVPAANENAV